MPIFKLSFGKTYFAPSIWSIIITLVLLPLLIALGYWQLHRAVEKQEIKNTYQLRSQSAPIDLNALQALAANQKYYPVQATGRFDNQHQFLLDNKIHNHQVGYEVLTPLILNSDRAILVNRGWIPQGANRLQVPNLQPVNGQVSVQGTIYEISTKSFALDNRSQDMFWPKRIQIIDFAQLEKLSGIQLMPMVILLDAKQSNGFVREWSPVNLNVNIHYGYAVQWFALALTLFVLFIVVNTHRKKSI